MKLQARRAAALIPALAVLTAPALAGQAAVAGPILAAQRTDAAHRAQGQAITLVIDSISPEGYARPGVKVTASGEITNATRAPLQGIRVQLWSSGTPFTNRSELDSYASGVIHPDQRVPGATAVLRTAIPPGQSVQWHASFGVNSVGMRDFGVYPLAAAAFDAAGRQIAVERTFLPFWSGKKAIAQPMRISWVWPLIDQPHRGACAAMLDNSLTANLAGGRLAGLLQTGRVYATTAQLTWAVDPALLDDANVISHKHRVLKGDRCGPTRGEFGSIAAAAWLRAVAAQQPVFATPYADPDVAALTHRGLDLDLAAALREGAAVTRQTLGRPGLPMAWPPDGIADSDVLDNMIAKDRSALGGSGQGEIKTVILDSSVMPANPSLTYTPDAVTQVHTGVGTTVRVLLADHTITSVLASASAGPGSAIAVSQRFLAETAMIAAEAPNLPRSIVVAPPRRWNPGSQVASQLLRDTVSAPWLRPRYLSKLKPSPALAGASARDRQPLQGNKVSRSELSPRYLRGVRDANADAGVVESILDPPKPLYRRAITRLESSAWRGSGKPAGQHLLDQATVFFDGLERMVAIIPSSEVTLGGHRGTVPVSIENKLPLAVRVRLQATVPATRAVPATTRLSVKVTQGNGIAIGPGKKQTVRLQVHAQAVGVNEVQLRLLTPQGAPIPGSERTLRVRSTAFGTFALVIIAVALGVLVLTSAARVIRRGIREGRPGSVVAESEPPDDDGSAEEPDELADARGGPQPDPRR
ncbi:MAG: DUF6049 family protein [Micromonosporaceae bacterium]